MRGFLSAAFALVVLQVFVTSPVGSQTSGLAGLAALPAGWANKFLDPTVPAISAPPKAKATTTSAVASTPTVQSASAVPPSPSSVPPARSPYVTV